MWYLYFNDFQSWIVRKHLAIVKSPRPSRISQQLATIFTRLVEGIFTVTGLRLARSFLFARFTTTRNGKKRRCAPEKPGKGIFVRKRSCLPQGKSESVEMVGEGFREKREIKIHECFERASKLKFMVKLSSASQKQRRVRLELDTSILAKVIRDESSRSQTGFSLNIYILLILSTHHFL